MLSFCVLILALVLLKSLFFEFYDHHISHDHSFLGSYSPIKLLNELIFLRDVRIMRLLESDESTIILDNNSPELPHLIPFFSVDLLIEFIYFFQNGRALLISNILALEYLDSFV